jgi:hypothetical protein
MKLTPTESLASAGFFGIVAGMAIIMLIPEWNKLGMVFCIIGVGLMMVSYQQVQQKEAKVKVLPNSGYQSMPEPRTVQLLDKHGNVIATESIDNVKKLRWIAIWATMFIGNT